MKKFVALYGAVLLLSFHFYFFYFINSTFLNQFFSPNTIGILYALAGIFNLFVFVHISKIIKSIGNYALLIGMICLEGLAIIGLAFLSSPFPIALAFIASTALGPVMIFSLDIFFESFSKNAHTGGVRGLLLMTMSIPPLICPFITGLLLSNQNYWKVYLVAALFLLPLLYIIILTFRKFEDPHYRNTSLLPALRLLSHHKNIYYIFVNSVLLNIFYAWMVIYMPLYLYNTLGYSLAEIGALFSIMIIPFVLFQLPLGNLADKKYGEKEIIIIGFIFMGLSTIFIPLLSGGQFFAWAVLLFLTRVGASFVEIGIESYFFKKVSSKDINLIGLFRSVRVLPYVIVPFIVGFILLFTDISHSFIFLGLLMLLGLRYTLPLRDTK